MHNPFNSLDQIVDATMPVIGKLSLLIALILNICIVVTGVTYLRPKLVNSIDPKDLVQKQRLRRLFSRAGTCNFLAMTSAILALVGGFVFNQFQMSYVLQHSNRDLPTIYRISALWSGQEGSMLFSAWILAAYGILFRIRKTLDSRLITCVLTIMAGIQIFYLLLLNVAARPFETIAGSVPADGFGLNPELQSPQMVLHPPMLYLGYIGFTVPFALTLSALIMHCGDEEWLDVTGRWFMVSWCFLTFGIILGAHWAYFLPGWGGYWTWDPVENMSLVPWLMGVAFLHTIKIQVRCSLMRSWNSWLVFSTYLSIIFGTLAARSGLVRSIHAFARSSIGTWLLGYMMVLALVCLFTSLRSRGRLADKNEFEAFTSRDLSFLALSLMIFVICLTILWGTIFPFLSRYLQGYEVILGAPYYNRVAVPVCLAALLVPAASPFLASAASSSGAILRGLIFPAAITIVVANILIYNGINPWEDLYHCYALIAFSFAAGLGAILFIKLFYGAEGIPPLTGHRLRPRLSASFLVHFGILFLVVGIAGATFNHSQEKELSYNDQLEVGPFSLVYTGERYGLGPNYKSESLVFDVYRDGQRITQLLPERRFYPVWKESVPRVANRLTLTWDLYIVNLGRNPTTHHPVVKVCLNALVAWIWIGAFSVISGTAVILTQKMLKPLDKLLTVSFGNSAD